MTQQQLLQEFRSFSTREQIELIDECDQIIQEQINEAETQTPNQNRGLTLEERIEIVKRLAGSAAIEGQKAPTNEEVKQDYLNYITEKYS